MRGATRIGNGQVWAALGLAVWVLDGNGGAFMQRLALGFAIELAVYKAVKQLFSRPRPFTKLPAVVRLIAPPDEFSFPSGHTAGAFVVLGIAGAAFSWLIAPLAILAALIGLSRVYLGVHYPSDVMAGALLGASAAGVALWAI